VLVLGCWLCQSPKMKAKVSVAALDLQEGEFQVQHLLQIVQHCHRVNKRYCVFRR